MKPKEKAEKDQKEVGDIWVVYEPTVRFPGAKKHPAPLVESKSLAAVKLPPLRVAIKIPREPIESGDLSDAHLEAIAYARQAHETKLENGARAGILIGDGTGTGKSRIAAGVILDNLKDGRRKAVWVTANERLFDSMKEALDAVGVDLPVVKMPSKADGKIEAEEGVLFIGYDKLGSQKRGSERFPRLDAVIEWLGPDFDGVIFFDEAHYASNLGLGEGNQKRGGKKPARRAIAADNLQNMVPDARVVYASATASVTPGEFLFMKRLGLWGPGAPFAKVENFLSAIEGGGLSAMEMLTNNLKAVGRFMARSISLEGVDVERLEVPVSGDDAKNYDTLAEAWKDVYQQILDRITEDASVATRDGYAIRQYILNRTKNIESTVQRFWGAVLVSLKARALVEDAKKRLEDGHSIVIQLVGTGESSMERTIASAREKGIQEDELQFGPREVMLDFVENYYPVQMVTVTYDEHDVATIIPVKDSKGNPVIDPDRVREKEKLLRKISRMVNLDNGLDILVNGLGPKNVAEVTGRRRRPIFDEETGKTRYEEGRTDRKIKSELAEFERGKRRVAIISGKGDTGISLHASNEIENRQRRVHYLLEPGWSPKRAIQGLGRTHRTNQASAPILVLVTTNLFGERRFISTIARRLAQLGALTHGERRAQGSGIVSHEDSLETGEAVDAYRRFYNAIVSGLIEGVSVDDLQDWMRIKVYKDDGGRHPPPPITRFLNGVLGLPIEKQNIIMEMLLTSIEDSIRTAIESGTYDIGLQDIHADVLEIEDEVELFYDDEYGASAKMVKINAVEYHAPMSFEELHTKYEVLGFYRKKRGKKILALVRAFRMIDSENVVTDRRFVDLFGEYGRRKGRVTADEVASLYEKVPKDEARKLWEAEYQKGSKEYKSTHYLIEGYVLPIWSTVAAVSRLGTRVRVRRAKIGGRTIVGLYVDPSMANDVLRAFGKKIKLPTWVRDPKKVADKILNDNVTVMLKGGGWFLRKKRVGFEDRIVFGGHGVRTRGVDIERLGVKVEFRYGRPTYFIPLGNMDVLAKVLEEWPIVDYGTDLVPDESEAEVAKGPPVAGSASTGNPRLMDPVRSYPHGMAERAAEDIRRDLGDRALVEVHGNTVYVYDPDAAPPSSGPPRFLADLMREGRVPSIEELKKVPDDEISRAADFLGVDPKDAIGRTIVLRRIRSYIRSHADRRGPDGKKADRVMPDPIRDVKPKKLYRITLDLSKSLRHKIHLGVRVMRRSAGYYHPSWARVAVRFEGDLSTTAHEVAHMLDDRFGILAQWDGQEWSPLDDELIPVFSQHGSKPSVSESEDPGAYWSYVRGEGLAEWIRAWIINPKVAERMAPMTYRHVARMIGDDTLALLRRFGDDIRAWYGSLPSEKTLSQIMEVTSKQSHQKRLAHSLAKMSGEFNLNWVDKLKTDILDELYPVVKAVNYVLHMKNMAHILPEKDPRVRARLMAGFDDKWHMIMMTGWRDHRGRPMFVSRVSTDPSGKVVIEETDERIGGIEWLMEPFKDSAPGKAGEDMALTEALMVAERVVEIWQNADKDAVAAILDKSIIPLMKSEVLKDRIDYHMDRITQEDLDKAGMAELDADDRVSAKKALAKMLAEQEVEEWFKPSKKPSEEAQEIAEVLSVLGALMLSRPSSSEAVRLIEGLRDGRFSDHLVPPSFFDRLRDAIERAGDRVWRDHAVGVSGASAGFGHDVVLARETIAELKASDPERYERLKEAARRYRAFADAALRYAVKAGRLAPDVYEKIALRNMQWVSFQRFMRGESGVDIFSHTASMIRQRKVLSKFKGSARPIKEVYSSLMLTSAEIVFESDRNLAIKSLTDILRSSRSMYEGDVINLDSVGSQAAGKDRNTITVFVNGKPEYWHFDKHVKDALEQIGRTWSPNAFEKMVHKILVDIPRTMITHFPNFMIRNIARDTVSRSVLTRVDSKPWDILMYATPKGSRQMRVLRSDAMFFGMGMFGWTRSSRTEYYRMMLEAIDEIRRGKIRAILTYPMRLWRGWSAFANSSEMLNRLAEYERARDYAMEKFGYDYANASLYASDQARDLLDFARAGRMIRPIARWILFLNPAIQGLYRTARSSPRETAKRTMLFIAFPSLVMWALRWMMYDDEDWEEHDQLSSYYKDLFWPVRLGQDTWVMIPKPWELGLFGSAIERGLDLAVRDTKRAFDGFFGSSLNALVPVDKEMLIGPFVPFAEAAANWDFFLNRPIVPYWEQELDPALRRGTDRASSTGKLLYEVFAPVLRAVNVDDPRKVDHLIESQLGGFGRMLTTVTSGDKDSRDSLSLLSGVVRRGPGWNARDVRWVFDYARRYGLKNDPGVRDMVNLLRMGSNERNPDRRQQYLRQARAIAAHLREMFEKSQIGKKKVEFERARREAMRTGGGG